MDLNFINNSPVDESKRTQVIDQFVNFIESVVDGIEPKDEETDVASTSTKSIEVKNEELTLTIGKQLFKSKPTEPSGYTFEDTNYKIDFNVAHFGEGRSNIHSETYSYSSNPSVKFVERMTGNMAMDGINNNHETIKHEVGEDEMTKMIEIAKQILYNKWYGRRKT